MNKKTVKTLAIVSAIVFIIGMIFIGCMYLIMNNVDSSSSGIFEGLLNLVVFVFFISIMAVIFAVVIAVICIIWIVYFMIVLIKKIKRKEAKWYHFTFVCIILFLLVLLIIKISSFMLPSNRNINRLDYNYDTVYKYYFC